MGAVDNPSLPRLGEVFLTFKAGTSGSVSNYIGYTIQSGTVGTARIVSGTGHFGESGTDQQVTVTTSATGNFTFKFAATTDCVVAFPGKYDIISFTPGTENVAKIEIEADDLKVIAPNITETFISVVNGDFDVSLFNSSAKINNTNGIIRGDVYGDATNYIDPARVTANSFYYNKLYADISTITRNLKYIVVASAKVTDDRPFSWKTTRSSDLSILATQGAAINFGNDVDAMLINQAACVVGDGRPADQYTINVKGTRTSSSDTAVATLKTMGFTIIVNGETL